MAFGGGTFETTNKVLPGVYINFTSQKRTMGTLGERGVVCMLLEWGWGPEGMQTVESGTFQSEAKNLLGYSAQADELEVLREVFCGAEKILLYRPEGGQKATATFGSLTAQAKYGGVRGNDITIAILTNAEEEEKFDVVTYVDTEEVDRQTITDASEVTSNDWVTFSGSGAMAETAGKPLSGGANAEVTGTSYESFLAEAEKENFQVLLYDGEEEDTKRLFAAFTKRMREEEGVKFVCVMKEYAGESEGIIQLGSGLEGCAWAAGKTAGAAVNESLTNALYDGERTLSNVKMTKSAAEKAIEEGKFLFYQDGEDVRVLRDINSFTEYTSQKNSDFSSNRVVRVMDGLANDVTELFSKYYLGKENNNADGRNLFKAEIVAYCDTLMQMGAIENFMAEDIVVEKGTEKQDVIISMRIQPVDSMEKIYMQVEIA